MVCRTLRVVERYFHREKRSFFRKVKNPPKKGRVSLTLRPAFLTDQKQRLISRRLPDFLSRYGETC